MRSSLRLRHLDAATRFRCRLRSILMRSCDSMSMGDIGGEVDAMECAGSSLMSIEPGGGQREEIGGG